ncbi:MAG TPA: peptide chain release factor N(5)-glutamine methyltransferase [Chitinophagaceae bacterium]|nr:peptide chain release factor N(5)-glutamine methyltransferase [Chitinophagaceae bacterium]
MTIKEARLKFIDELKKELDPGETKNIAELALEKISGLSKTEQIKYKETLFNADQIDFLEKIISRLKQQEPIQYILGEAWFAGMKFKVNKSVLIPRPETEELVEWIVHEAGGTKPEIRNILEVGTGSGCIAIAIKKKLQPVSLSAIDVCSEAIFTATENAIALETDIEFILLDFLDEKNWNGLGKFDVIVSNPPYVRQNEKQTMHKRVVDFEPSLALFVPDNDALLFYKKLADFAKMHLTEGGKLFVEINETLGKEVSTLFQTKGFNSIEIRNDMQGKERMVKAVMINEL